MKAEIVETISQSEISFNFGPRFSKDELLGLVSSFDDFLSKFSSFCYVLLENNSVSFESETSATDVIDHLIAFILEQSSEDTVYTLKIVADKKAEGMLVFYSYEKFSAIYSGDPRKDVKLLAEITSSFSQLYFHDGPKTFDFDLKLENKYSPENIFHRYNFEEKVGLNPGLAYQLGCDFGLYEKDNYTIKIFLYMCMVIWSNKAKKEDGVYHFVFEGLRKSSIEINFSNIVKISYDDVFELFTWVFCDSASVAKVSIIRNVISSNHVDNVESLFSKEIILIIESNFQLYHQDNIKQYFELKNKVIDFIFSVGNKVSDAYDSYFNSNKVSLIAVLSYVATLLIVRGVAQNQFESNAIFVCILSILYFVVCFIYVFLVKSELDSKVLFYKNQKDELKGRYENMLSKLELESIFSSNTFESAVTKSERAKFHIVVFSILGILCLVVICIMIFLISYPKP